MCRDPGLGGFEGHAFRGTIGEHGVWELDAVVVVADRIDAYEQYQLWSCGQLARESKY